MASPATSGYVVGPTLYRAVTDMSGVFLFADGASAIENLSIFAPTTPAGHSICSLFILVLALTGAIFLLVEGVLICSLVRFRRAAPEATEPPQVYGSQPIEIAWTSRPCSSSLSWRSF
jgi:cytochrome c oxidase subunit 2